MITLEGQLTKALTEMDATSRLHLFLNTGKEVILVNSDVVLIGAESLKIVERLKNRTKRGTVKIISYDCIDHIYYTVNETIHSRYSNAGSTPEEINQDNIPTEPEQIEPIQNEEKGEVLLTIKNENGDTISDATVTISKDNKEYTGTSDNDGNVVIENIPYGEYTIQISASGYETISETITINVDSTIEDYTLNAEEAEVEVSKRAVAFKVYSSSSENDAPIENATVTLEGDESFTGNTDSNGSCIIENVSYGDYTVSVVAENFTSLSNESLTIDGNTEIVSYGLNLIYTATTETFEEEEGSW